MSAFDGGFNRTAHDPATLRPRDRIPRRALGSAEGFRASRSAFRWGRDYDTFNTTASKVVVLVREFVMRQVSSAFSSRRRARSSLVSWGTDSVARTTNSVKRVAPSLRSRVPATSHFNDIHESFEDLAMARKLRMKQPATAAVNKVSGDHLSPGPPNSAGGAEGIASSPSLARPTSPSGPAAAVTL